MTGQVEMPRYIAVERHTGRLYVDSARLAPSCKVASPTDAVMHMDRIRGRAMRGFGFVPKGSPNGDLVVYEIPDAEGEPRRATESDAQALALVESRGRYVTTLITYNS